MDNLSKFVGANIREIRKQKKLTQEELAERSGIQTSFLVGVESGKRNITLQTLEKIINGLQVETTTIFNFKNLNMDEQYFNKMDLIDSLVSLLTEKSEDEVKLIHRVAKEIFDTYNS